ncbi:MAG: hypothetical protein MI784_16100 [Cytophagales bacterium]|nr:hypothetical protein [Cytophagales bacterium]
MKKLFLLVCVFCYSLSYSQENYRDNLIDYFHEGVIYLENGEEIKGKILIDELFPNCFRNMIYYINTPEEEDFIIRKNKLKKKFYKKIKPKKVLYMTIENERKFVSIKYADLTQLGLNSIPARRMFEEMDEVSEGPIKLYKDYKGIYLEDGKTVDELGKELVLHPYKILIYKDGKLKSIRNVKLQDYIMDQAEVFKKYEAERYGDLTEDFSTLVKSGLKEDDYYEDDLIRLVNDYNEAVSEKN